MSHSRRIVACVLFAIVSNHALAQPGRSEGRRSPQDQRPVTPMTAADDLELKSLRELVTADNALWQSMIERYDSFRREQIEAIRATREKLRRERGMDSAPPPREEMENALAEVLPPIRSRFIEALRTLVPAEKQDEFDHWAQTAKFDPPRPGARPLNSRTSSEPLPANQVSMTTKDAFRYFEANGIPDHEHGKFPGPGNPNAISAQRYSLRVPLKPVALEKSIEVRGVLAGVAVNGVVFDPGTAEFWKDDPETGWRMEAIAPQGVEHRSLGIDASHAHVQPTGAYHYHGAPLGIIERIAKERGIMRGSAMILIGYSADGFPMYDSFGPKDPNDLTSEMKRLSPSYQLKAAPRPDGEEGPGGQPDGVYTRDWEFVKDSGDLDECNGRYGVTPEYPEGTYYYVITESFPYIHRRFKGTPDDSFKKHDGPPPSREGGRRGRQNAR